MDYRATFDAVANSYDEVRPGYPEAVIEKIVSWAHLGEDSSLLEVGVGTGQITRPFAERGCRVTGLELGSNLAAFAQRNLSAFPNVTILNTAFEDYQAHESFDLLLSAQAFHWIEPDFGLRKTAELLKPDGKIALVWQLDKSSQTPFYKATTPYFERYVNVADDPERPTPPAKFADYTRALTTSPLFSTPRTWSTSWQTTYSKDDYLKLLQTFSPVIGLEPKPRAAFLGEVARVLDDFGGAVERFYETVLLFAVKR